MACNRDIFTLLFTYLLYQLKVDILSPSRNVRKCMLSLVKVITETNFYQHHYNFQSLDVLTLFFFKWVGWDFGYCGHYWAIVPAPDDRWWWLWREICGMKIGRGNRSTRRKPAPAPLLSTTNPTWLDPGLRPGRRRGGKPATNLLSYCVAFWTVPLFFFRKI
jgi:hypothetical protein